MRYMALVVLVMLCTVSVADTDVADLSAAEAAELERAEVHAEAARDALEMLFRGIESAPESAREETADVSPSQRAEHIRTDEPSVGRVPAGYLDAAAERAFKQLRDNLLATHDVVLMRNELAAYVTAHPHHREARVTLARLYILSDSPGVALQTLAPLLTPLAKRQHPDWQPWFWAGTAYLAEGDHARARQMLDAAVAKDSASADVWIQLAVLEQEVDNHSGALQYIAIAEQLDADAGAVHLNRGYSLERLGRLEDALSAYQRFLVSDMSHSSVSLRPTVMRRIADIAAVVEQRKALRRT